MEDILKNTHGEFSFMFFLLAVMTALQIVSTILVADAIEMGTHKMLEPAESRKWFI